MLNSFKPALFSFSFLSLSSFLTFCLCLSLNDFIDYNSIYKKKKKKKIVPTKRKKKCHFEESPSYWKGTIVSMSVKKIPHSAVIKLILWDWKKIRHWVLSHQHHIIVDNNSFMFWSFRKFVREEWNKMSRGYNVWWKEKHFCWVHFFATGISTVQLVY